MRDDQGVTRPIELKYVLDVTGPHGETERLWLLTRYQAYELADRYRAQGFMCAAHDDDYGYTLDLDPETRG